MSEPSAPDRAACKCCGEMVAWVNVDGVCMAKCNLHSLAESAEHRRVGHWSKLSRFAPTPTHTGREDVQQKETK